MGSLVGVSKIAASRVGLTLERYQEKVQQGLKWCFRGKHWKPLKDFHTDKSRGDGKKSACIECRPKPLKVPKNLAPNTSVQQSASNAVRTAVRRGSIPKVTDMLCKCGKPARHYHHTHGYKEEHWLDVVPVCNACHRKEHWE